MGLGCFAADVDFDFGERRGGQGVDVIAWLGSGRVDENCITGDLAHQPGCHLRLSAVLNAHEQHRGCLAFIHRAAPCLPLRLDA